MVSYVSTVGLKDSIAFSTFAEAFKDFFDRIKAVANEGTMSLQFIETTCWIKRGEFTCGFYDARDLAYNIGVFDGESVNASVADPDIDLSVVFVTSHFTNGNAGEVIKEISVQ